METLNITVPESVAAWVRTQADQENTSISELLIRLLEAQMKQGYDYADAYRRWKQLPDMDIDAANRLSREEAHARR
jgi:hypothetical protein